MRVYPSPGLKVRDPVSKDLLNDEGREVSDTDPFWARRLFQHDVVLERPASDSTKQDDKEAPVETVSVLVDLQSNNAADDRADTGSEE